ncbi:MAG: hypothetical protein WCC10_01400 [Tumebacillaceae bacterium]
MNLEYTFITLDSGIVRMKLPTELALIEDFLLSDVGFNNGGRYLKLLNSAIHTDTFDERITGNTTTLCINPSKTLVINNPLDSEMEIETHVLRNIVEIYARNVYIHKLNLKLKREQELITRSVNEIIGSTGTKLIETIESVDENLRKWA